ncbi:fructosamine kinase family protein [Actinomyces faecalis]|uniref:fructosamine kinase family protein n=1 Tax=Actinomyces faecalis TaxID=2722820 RepID=UPI002E2C9BC0|nr:fructosamine kinase family protein [Actinomyces faecalis]
MSTSAPSPSQAWTGPLVRKHDESPGATALEAQGLHWLAEAMDDGGAAVVPVRTGPGWLEEPQLTDVGVTARAAEAFGRRLALTHAAGAPAFGAAPPGWDGRTRMGRSDIRLRPHAPEPGDAPSQSWGRFYAEDRIVPYIQPGRDNGSLTRSGATLLERVCSRLVDGDLDSDQPALTVQAARERGARTAVARTHGDLWTGNVLWVPATEVAGDGRVDVVGVLIDPMAHGAHAETDLAALGVFGQPYLERIVAAYNEVSPLAAGWRERVGLHQLHMLMIHVFLFGGGYGVQAEQVARRYA